MAEAPDPDYRAILQDPLSIARFVRERIESKIAWYRSNAQKYAGRTWPTWQDKVLEVFYEDNLSIRLPGDGILICKTGDVLMVDWKSPCHILDRCKATGAPTLHVCTTLYHVQYQVLLSLILPGALFSRDYTRLRPESEYCRETIFYYGPPPS
jgi:hypothetical protein